MTEINGIWDVKAKDFPQTATTAAKLKFLLNYAILAPSSHNTQPWRFQITANAIYLYADRTRLLPIADPQGRELIISCGAALFNLRMAIRHFGYMEKITTFPEPEKPDLLACIELGEHLQPSTDDDLLFRAIPRRHTNRHDYQDWDIPETFFKWLQKDASQEGGYLHVVKNGTVRRTITDLVAEADHLQMADANYRSELATWMRPSNSKSHDGIPVYAHGIDEYFDFTTPLFALVLRNINMGDSVAEHSRKLLENSPAIIVLATETDTPSDWLAIGQALERVLLRGQVVGLSTSFLNQPIQVPELRSQLSQLLDCCAYPQIILRLGFGVEVKPTPRRSVDEVMSSSLLV
ncbi:Acg family FMN-binding oxidoreductase [Calothrix sp. UHCC 0171]|uniref:Acg family FMN-binding oxidoreductase n=1 Tax=Calothrix sp. UHCC 0171 TaxID=3110245 RepID=UPI002B216A46|nr:nitroreductase [Calothrix sp. UHCC 0171]MEA5572198.1 nitroreductase [Calothrix sp. UHCC 0171]